MTALLICFAAGSGVIRWLAAKKIGQAVRTDGPQTHLVKTGTPTMGGVMILIAIGVTTLLWADLSNKYVWTVLIVTLGYGIVGWYDDWKKVVYRDPKGLSAKWKYFGQSVLGRELWAIQISDQPGVGSIWVRTGPLAPLFQYIAPAMDAV